MLMSSDLNQKSYDRLLANESNHVFELFFIFINICNGHGVVIVLCSLWSHLCCVVYLCGNYRVLWDVDVTCNILYNLIKNCKMLHMRLIMINTRTYFTLDVTPKQESDAERKESQRG